MRNAMRSQASLLFLVLFVLLFASLVLATSPSGVRAAGDSDAFVQPLEEPPPECDAASPYIDASPCCDDGAAPAEDGTGCGDPDTCSAAASRNVNDCRPACPPLLSTSRIADNLASQPCPTSIFGPVVSQPQTADLVGEWKIASLAVTVDPSTLLDSRMGALALGTLVRVDFDMADGARVARTVRTLWPSDGGDWWHWRSGRGFGSIESMPLAESGNVWVIASIEYAVTEATRYSASALAFAAGTNVRVEYYRTEQGERVARTIEATSDTGNGGGLYRFVGIVDARPDSVDGDWTIGGVPFVVAATTRMNDAKGVLAAGAHASVRYDVVENRLFARELATVVPPGAGERRALGQIVRMGTGTISPENVWIVGSELFVVTPGTLLDDELSPLEVGQLAFVNAYAESDGTIVATSVEGIPADLQQFLPMTQVR